MYDNAFKFSSLNQMNYWPTERNLLFDNQHFWTISGEGNFVHEIFWDPEMPSSSLLI